MMNKLALILTIAFNVTLLLNSQTPQDSLVRFSELIYHSDIEKQATLYYLEDQMKAFDLFMAIDEEISNEDIKVSKDVFQSTIDELKNNGIETKKINKKIQITYQDIHSKFLKKYNENEYFPVMFETGTYNCVSASMLYALAFDQLNIPYKVMASSSHVYLIADPGMKSVVIETTNPSFENAIFNGEFKRQYVDYLRSSKMISEDEYKNKSVEEIFEEKFNEVKEIQYKNLPGIQYYNKALTKFDKNDFFAAYELSKKAYFFYPDEKVKVLLYNTTLFQIERCSFNEVTDIDYLLQYTRFEDADNDVIKGIFGNIIMHALQFTDKEEFCNELHDRFVSQLTDEELKNDISFNFYLMMGYQSRSADKRVLYLCNAIRLKSNHRDANMMFSNALKMKFQDINDPYALADSIEQYSIKYNFDVLSPAFDEYRLLAYLKIAETEIDENNIKAAMEYLDLFEQNCNPPIEIDQLEFIAERVYRKVAVYYYYRNKTKAKEIVNKGLVYIPNSRSIKSAIY